MTDNSATTLASAQALYLGALRDGAVAESARRHIVADFMQHATGVADGLEGFIGHYEGFVKSHPQRDIRIERALVDGNLVFLHSMHTLDAGASRLVASTFLKANEDDQFVEQWDVTTPYAAATPSGHTSIDGPTQIEDRHSTEVNKRIVRDMIEQVLIPGGDPHRVDEWIDDVYIQHNAEVADGLAPFKELAVAPDKPLLYDEIVLVVGEGNFVATLCRATWDGAPVAQVDLFRLAGGKIVEHWDASEMVTGATVNSGKF